MKNLNNNEGKILNLLSKEHIDMLCKLLKENPTLSETNLFSWTSIERIEHSPSKLLLEQKDIKELKVKGTTTEKEVQFKMFWETLTNDDIGLNVTIIGRKNLILDCKLILFPNDLETFLLEFQEKKIYECEGILEYSPIEKIFTIKELKIYHYKTPYKSWINLYFSSNISLNSRIEHLLTPFGVKYSALKPIEKITFLSRLVPLVEKKYLFVDIAKPEIGKTYPYSLLGYNLYSTNVTRSSLFLDGRNKKKGDFYSETEALIIDEIGKINDPEVIDTIQVYKNGDEDEGYIQAGFMKKTSTNSIILLGNPKDNIDYEKIWENKINLFKDTIISSSKDIIPFLSRVDGMPLSYDCRTFNDSMKGKVDKDTLNLFKEVIPILREKTIDIEFLLNKHNLNKDLGSSRTTSAIYKTLKGLLKLLYPEGIENNFATITTEDLTYLFEMAMYSRQLINNQIAIIENKPYTSYSYTTQFFQEENTKCGFSYSQFHYGQNPFESTNPCLQQIGNSNTLGMIPNNNCKWPIEPNWNTQSDIGFNNNGQSQQIQPWPKWNSNPCLQQIGNNNTLGMIPNNNCEWPIEPNWNTQSGIGFNNNGWKFSD